MMKKNQIGKTGLYVNPIGLGANSIGGYNLYPNLGEEIGKKLAQTALKNGINFIDTAFSYGRGRSEELVGETIQELGMRDDVILATKGAQRFTPSGMQLDNSPAFLKQTVEESLKRLKTDYIDLFYIHFPDENTPKDEAVGALKQLKDEGKIRAIGVSNFTMEQLREANKDGYVDVYQGEYSLISREVEKEILPYAVEHQISFVPFYPLASGLLAGKYTKDTVFDDYREKMPHLQGEAFVRNLEKVESLREIANVKGQEVAQVVLAWLLRHDAIDVIIPGAKRTGQIENNLKTLEVQLTEAEIKAIDRIFG